MHRRAPIAIVPLTYARFVLPIIVLGLTTLSCSGNDSGPARPAHMPSDINAKEIRPGIWEAKDGTIYGPCDEIKDDPELSTHGFVCDN